MEIFIGKFAALMRLLGMQFLMDLFYLFASALLWPLWGWRILTGRLSPAVLWKRAVGVAILPDDDRAVVWFHASSVGEVLLLGPLLKQLPSRSPPYRFVISTETSEGLHAAKIAFPDAASIIPAPLDLSWCVRRAYSAIRPRLLVLSELELWPNLLLEARRRGTPVAVVNSRMNDADFRFFRRINRWHRPALAAIRWWGAQTSRDAERIRLLSVPSRTIVEVTGSLKFEAVADGCAANAAQELYRLLGFSPDERVFVAGSTHAPEEQVLLDAFLTLMRVRPELRLVLAPREPRRFAEVAEMLRRRGVSFAQRSQLAAPRERSAVVTLLDSIGELPAFWRHADFGFVGGSLAPCCGGQNVIEPAALGIPVCFGPNVWNFSEAAAGLLQAGAAREVGSQADIVTTVADWVSDPARKKQIGDSAADYVQRRQGASAITLRALDEMLANKASARPL